MSGYNVFAAAPDAGAGLAAARQQARLRAADTRQALGNPAARAWLQARLREEDARPSYVPGMTFDHSAYLEGRKAVLREIARELFPETEPTAG